jgi:hypothetical protein
MMLDEEHVKRCPTCKLARAGDAREGLRLAENRAARLSYLPGDSPARRDAEHDVTLAQRRLRDAERSLGQGRI